MKKLFVAVTVSVALLLSGCMSSHPAYSDDGYYNWMKATTEKVKLKSDYRRIPIDTREQGEDYTELSYRAYKKEISKTDFVREMESRYPGYLESIQFIANQLPD